MPNDSRIVQFVAQWPWWLKALAACGLAAGLFYLLGRAKTTSNGTTFVARRGPLQIAVLEGGSLEALESQDVKCEVRGYQGVKILKIVEEGYQVTEDDVRTNKVLVELDASELRKQMTQREIDLGTSVAALVDARQAFDIQINQNLSDVKAAEQKARFARMDLEKFMGDRASKDILDQTELRESEPPNATNLVMKAAAGTAASGQNSTDIQTAGENELGPKIAGNSPRTVELVVRNRGDEPPRVVLDAALATAADPPTNAAPAPKSAAPEPPGKGSLDFSKYVDSELLGDGEAKQKMRKFDDELQVAQRELGISKTMLEGTQRLNARGFVTKTELDSDEIKLENSRLKVQTAETARALFRKYEFPRTAEELLSKYAEALRELGRARKSAVSKLAQAEAKVKGAEGRNNLEVTQRADLADQLDKCLIRSKKIGLVVYGGGNMNMFYYGQEQIREGALVREQQPIITIPDMTRMAVKVRIHESYIKKIKPGQQVRITADAFPDKLLEGEVSKVGLLPDSQNRWMNPDLKVYLTTITINGTYDWLKPGMSAKVEIRVKELPDVVYVPIQAVAPIAGKQFCYLAARGQPEQREVEVGEFNDEFIEIKRGLREGDRVCLRAQPVIDKEGGDKKPIPAEEEKSKPAGPAPPMKVGSTP